MPIHVFEILTRGDRGEARFSSGHAKMKLLATCMACGYFYMADLC